MNIRHVCAVAGIAVAAGTVVFTRSLVATNDYQAVAVAERLLAAMRVDEGTKIANLQLDYRPDGHVMQGPPLMATLAVKRGIDGVEVARSVFAQRRLSAPEPGSELTLVGRKGAYKVKISKLLDWDKPARGYPNMFVPESVAAAIDDEWRPLGRFSAETLAPQFTSDAGRNFDRAKVLLLWAAALTALCLLVNSLFLSIEAKRRTIAIERVLGATRWMVVKAVLREATKLTLTGYAFGCALAVAALYAYVASDESLFPLGPKIATGTFLPCAIAALGVAMVSVLVLLKKALDVKPLEAASSREPKRRHFGMLLSFAFGFAAFVAVEVWGSSLMSAFIPSPEWPDAIVSILPGGISSFDVEKLQAVEGVESISELQPLQVNILPLEELPAQKGMKSGDRPDGRKGPPMKQYRNALLLASSYLPRFKFAKGNHDECAKLLVEGDNCVITEMMARARKLDVGDKLELDCGRGLVVALDIVGIVDLNWHMVTSRGLLRGLNRMAVHTDGPVFVSFDTLAACDARAQEMVKMTHLWVDYKPDLAKESGGVFEAGRIVEKRILEALDGAYDTNRDGKLRGNTVRLHSRDEIADGTLSHGNDMIGSVARVPFIFIAVISLGFIASIVASVDARKREFRVLRMVGATRGQLARILVGEALSVAAWGMAFGLVIGAAAGWLFTFPTRAMMSSWGLPATFAIPWLVIAKGAAGAVLFALIVSIPASMFVVSRRD